MKLPEVIMKKEVDALRSKIIERVDKYGYTFVYVGASKTTPSFVYTVGLAKKSFPEIIAFDLEHSLAQGIICDVVNEWAKLGTHRVGIYPDLVTLVGGQPCNCEINIVTSEEVIEKYVRLTRHVLDIDHYHVAQLTPSDLSGRSISDPDFKNDVNMFILPSVKIN